MITQFSIYIDPRSTRRIDTFLASLFPEHSRSRVQKLIDIGRVLVNGKVIVKSIKVYNKDVIDVDFTPDKNTKFEAEDIPLDIVYECEDFAIINKDPFMSVHPASAAQTKSGTLVNALMYHFGSLSVIGGVERPGIAHRLDKDTSGLIYIAKNDRSMKLFQHRIQERKVQKTYLALVIGIPKEEKGYIESYIGRDPHDRKKMSAINPLNPKIAKTEFKVLGTIEWKYSLLEVNLMTGRTHQIRVHLSSIGFPILWDIVYGKTKENAIALEKYWLQRQWLHAHKLSFDIFKTRYSFSWALKQDLLAIPGIKELWEFETSEISRNHYGNPLKKEPVYDEEDISLETQDLIDADEEE